MIGSLKSVLHWYEKAAHDYADGDLPNQNSDITLDRLWNLCKKYAFGVSPRKFIDNRNFRGKQSRSDISFFFFSFPSSSNKSRDSESLVKDFLLSLAAIFVITFIYIWLFSGIALHKVIDSLIPAVKNFVENACVGLGGVVGAVLGIIPSLIMGMFSNRKNTYFDFIKAGASSGYDIGAQVGGWLGWFVGLATIPVSAIVSFPLGIAAGLPIGLLTLVVAPLKFVNTIYNSVNIKLEEASELNNSGSIDEPRSLTGRNKPGIDYNDSKDIPVVIFSSTPDVNQEMPEENNCNFLQQNEGAPPPPSFSIS